MRVGLVAAVIGQMLRLFTLAFVPPFVLALYDREWNMVLGFGGATLAAFVTSALTLWRHKLTPVFQRSEAFGVVAGTWLVVAGFAAIPFWVSGMAPIDAYFESMSGFTTTGATVITDFSVHGRAFFLWRGMCQWFGGLGVIALFVVVLPRLGVSGRQLFFAEASGAPSEAISPQIRDAASRLWLLYGAMTLVLIGLLFWSGMPIFDSICNAFGTMAAGGFSPNGLSIAGYQNPVAEWILVVFMLLAGASFTLQWRVYTREPLGFFRDQEFVFYTGVMVVFGVAAAIAIAGGCPGEEELRQGLFQSSSLISSTGFASTDYNLWPDVARVCLIVVMVVGGCAGSAAGGPKAVRYILVLKHIHREILTVLHPRGVSAIRYKGRPVSYEIMRAVMALVALYLAGYFILGVVVVLLGTDLVTGFSVALACLGNIGPGLGPAGPMGSFAGFSDPTKIVLTVAMWIGRLEIVAVLSLLHPHVWKNLRWGR